MDERPGQTRRGQPYANQYSQQSTREPNSRNAFPPPPIGHRPSPRSHQQRQDYGHASPKHFANRQQYSTANLVPQPRPYQHVPYGQPNSHSALQAPQPTFRHPSRHLSHISALSTSEAAIDSRPISEIESHHEAVRPPNYPPSEIDTLNSPHSSRHTSPGRKSKKRGDNHARRSPGIQRRHPSATPSADPTATMQALTAAIRQGIGPSDPSNDPTTAKHNHDQKLRMPFQDEPSSPSSVYTDLTNNKHGSVPLPALQGYNAYHSKHSTISEKASDDFEKDDEKSDFGRDMPTPMSHVSQQPMVDGEKPGMSSRVPLDKRPPKLNINAVREAEARGSMTSLSDLIKRATKLASNLDRGRTASRLGHLDMFGSSEKLPNARVRDSTYSDIMAAFPSPADAAGTPKGNRPTTMWPNANKQAMASKSSLGLHGDGNNRPRRQCCGLSPPIFALILIIVILLVAAAVLVPLFLVVIIPKQHKSIDVQDCSASHVCQHGGASVVLSDTCACVCVDGFTGSTCSVEKDPECITASLEDGSKTYDNATVGSSILSTLQDQQKTFGLPLNVTTILATFSSNNLSCASENSLVDFGSMTTNVRRYLDDLGTMNFGEETIKLDTTDDLEAQPSKTRDRRQDATQSANGIVFATSSASTTAPAVSAAKATSSTTATATSTSAQPKSTNKATDQQRDFASAIVLFVLQSNQVSVAVSASQAISAYFESSTSGNGTVEVVSGSQRINANFDDFKITFANGTSIGGKG